MSEHREKIMICMPCAEELASYMDVFPLKMSRGYCEYEYKCKDEFKDKLGIKYRNKMECHRLCDWSLAKEKAFGHLGDKRAEFDEKYAEIKRNNTYRYIEEKLDAERKKLREEYGCQESWLEAYKDDVDFICCMYGMSWAKRQKLEEEIDKKKNEINERSERERKELIHPKKKWFQFWK